MKEGSNLPIYLAIAVGIFATIAFSKKKPDEKAAPNSKGLPAPIPEKRAGATISLTQAKRIADNIEDAISYASGDWQRIAMQFQELQNNFDVETLYDAFGDRDGKGFVNGDLFNFLNKAYEQFKYFPYIQPALKSIKIHCFGYQKYIVWM